MATTELATRLKDARERIRYTQREVADALEVDRKTVDNWENGRTVPRNSMGALKVFYASFGIDITDDGIQGLPPLVAENRDNPEVMAIWEIPDEKISTGARLVLIRLWLGRHQNPPPAEAQGRRPA